MLFWKISWAMAYKISSTNKWAIRHDNEKYRTSERWRMKDRETQPARDHEICKTIAQFKKHPKPHRKWALPSWNWALLSFEIYSTVCSIFKNIYFYSFSQAPSQVAATLVSLNSKAAVLNYHCHLFWVASPVRLVSFDW